MYSLIHLALVRMVEAMDDGSDKLDAIFELVDDTGNPKGNCYRPFTDQESLRLIEAAGQVLGLSVDDVIAGMGKVQLATFTELGYLPLINALGRTFYEFLQNIDALHTNLVQAYPSMIAPSIRPELKEGAPLLVHYYSSRPGLWPYANSLLHAVSRDVFHEDLVIEHSQKRHEGHDHDIFKISTRGYDSYLYEDTKCLKELGQHELSKRSFSREQVNDMFPWHLEFDRTLNVTSLGTALSSRFQALENKHLKLTTLCKIVRPNTLKQDFDSFLQYDRQSFIVIVRDETYFAKKVEKRDERREARREAGHQGAASQCPMHKQLAKTVQEGSSLTNSRLSRASSTSSIEGENFISEAVDYLYLKGEFVYFEDTDTIFMAATPHISDPKDMYLRGMSLHDMPVHSNGRDLLFSAMHQSATIGIARTLEETMESLNSARAEINKEKARVEELLHGILPRARPPLLLTHVQTIAEKLSQGVRPEAERYRGATILFSDIVGFTKLSSSVRPQSVMNMLNELFSKFDALCDEHNVFKVETIGDAYMVACGLPVPNDEHPRVMARFALAMARVARSVQSPVDGTPLRIRIGMHSGPVMAGVVGLKAPRYCLFGDTVNVASRMESNSLPGCIQMSASMMSELHERGGGFTIRSRGDLEIKGKGRMETFLLLGEESQIDYLVPPEDSIKISSTPAASPAQMYSMGVSAPAPERYFDVVIKHLTSVTRLSGVCGSSTLDDVLFSATGKKSCDGWRLFCDGQHHEVLMPTQALLSLVDGDVIDVVIAKNPRTQRPINRVVLFAGEQFSSRTFV